MATSTASLAQSSIPPRLAYAGTTTVVAPFRSTETLAGSTVILMAKVPHGAVITDGLVNFGENNQALIFKCGLNLTGQLTRFFSATASDVVRFSAGLPYVVSVSDGAVIRHVWVSLQASGQQISTTFSCTMMLQYVPLQQ